MTYSMGTGLIVLEAAKLAKSGESIDTIISVINDLAKTYSLLLILLYSQSSC